MDEGKTKFMPKINKFPSDFFLEKGKCTGGYYESVELKGK